MIGTALLTNDDSDNNDDDDDDDDYENDDFFRVLLILFLQKVRWKLHWSTCNSSFLYLKINPEMLDTLYKYAKFQYECGNYSGAAEYLYFYRVLVSFSSWF